MQLLNEKNLTNEEKNYYRASLNIAILIIVGIVGLLAVSFVALTNGNYDTSLRDIVATIKNPANNQQIYSILVYSRLPRLLAAFTVGAALSSSGWVFQEVFTNRMVSPDILGVSSGAGVGASVAIIMGCGMSMVATMAFGLGLVSVVLTMLISKIFSRNSDKILSIILSGIVISGLMSSVLGFLKYISNDAQLATITYWLLGGFYNVIYKEIKVAIPIIIVFLVILILIRWRIMILKNGEIDANVHGVNYFVTRNIAIIIATILTAVSVSISGTIGWIGLAVPNLIRLLVRDNEKQVLPLVIIYGAVFTGISDFLARSITGTEIPIGIITGILGGVVFIVAIAVRRCKNG